MFELPQPEQGEYQLEGWQAAGDLTQAEIQYNQWQTLLIDGQQLPICRFDYTNTNGQSATFVGSLNAQRNVCEGSRDMRWYNDYQIDSPVGQYELLSQFGAGNVTYTPNAEIGEVQLCTLNKPHNNGSHDGQVLFAMAAVSKSKA